jgi:hypothetical protein
MLPDSPQNIVVRAPSPSMHYIPGSISSDTSSTISLTPQNHQQTSQSITQSVSESWCLTSVKVIKVCANITIGRSLSLEFRYYLCKYSELH